MFLPSSPLPYQNDPNVHVISFVSGQSDMPRWALYWGGRDRRLKKEPSRGPGIEWAGSGLWPYSCSGLVAKPSSAVAQHIDFLKVNLALYFCPQVLSHIKKTLISMLYRFHMVSMKHIFLVSSLFGMVFA